MKAGEILTRMRAGATLCRSKLCDGRTVWQLDDGPGLVDARTGRNLARRSDLHPLPKSEAPPWADQAWALATTH